MAAKKKIGAQFPSERLMARRTKALAHKEAFRSLMQDVEDYSSPDRASWVKSGEGQKKNRTYDSTAIQSRNAFANRIQSDMMPPFQKWVVLKAGDFVPTNKRQAIQAELDEATDKAFALVQASNFDTAVNEFLQDLAAGTAVMMPRRGEDKDTPKEYYAIPPAQVAIEEGALGKIIGVYRDYEIPTSQIQEVWEDAELTEEMNADLKRNSKRDDKNWKLIECCVKVPGTKKEWYYAVIEEGTKKKIVERSYSRNRFLVLRWSKMAGEVWGRGPLVSALPDIKTLNKLVEMILRHAALRIAGVWAVANDGVINANNVKITPGATIPVGRVGPQGSITNIAPEGDIQVAELEREKLSTNIKRILFDHQLPPDTGPVRSATEIVQRVKELMKDIGAPFGRIMSEFVVPFYQDVLDDLYDMGMIRHPIQVDGLMVKAQIISPLAQLQSLTDVENVVRWLQIMASFGNETLYMGSKIEDVGDWLGEKLGVPTILRRTQEERKKMQQQVGQMIAQQKTAPPIPAGQAAASGNSVPIA